jgi:hypothetical protein
MQNGPFVSHKNDKFLTMFKVFVSLKHCLPGHILSHHTILILTVMKTSNHIQGMEYELANLRIWFKIHASAENFGLFQSLPTSSGTPSPPPPIQWAQQVFFPGTNGPKQAEIRIAWSYALLSPYICMAWALSQHKDNHTW